MDELARWAGSPLTGLGFVVASMIETWIFGGPADWRRATRLLWMLPTLVPGVIFVTASLPALKAGAFLVTTVAFAVTLAVGIVRRPKPVTATRPIDESVGPNNAQSFLHAEFIAPTVHQGGMLTASIRVWTQQRLPSTLRVKGWKLIDVYIDGVPAGESATYDKEEKELRLTGATDLPDTFSFSSLPMGVDRKCISISAILWLDVAGDVRLKLPVGEQYCRIAA